MWQTHRANPMGGTPYRGEPHIGGNPIWGEDPAAHKEDTGYDEDRMENPDRHLTRIEDDNLINFMDVKNEENPEDNVHARYKY